MESNNLFTFIYGNVLKHEYKWLIYKVPKKLLTVQSRQKNAKIIVRRGLL